MDKNIDEFFKMYSVYYNIDITDVTNALYPNPTKHTTKNLTKHTTKKPTKKPTKRINDAKTNTSDPNVKKSMYIVQHRSLGFFWHPESRFVFDKDTKRVTGVYSENDVHKLNEQDIKICKTYGFKIMT